MALFNIFDIIFPKFLQLNVTSGQTAPFPITTVGLEIRSEWQTCYLNTTGFWGLTNATGGLFRGSGGSGNFPDVSYTLTTTDQTDINNIFLSSGLPVIAISTRTGFGFLFDNNWKFRCMVYNNTGTSGTAQVYTDAIALTTPALSQQDYATLLARLIAIANAKWASGNSAKPEGITKFPINQIIDGIATGVEENYLINFFTCSDGFPKTINLGGQLSNPGSSSSNITLRIRNSGNLYASYAASVVGFSSVYVPVSITGQIFPSKDYCNYAVSLQINSGFAFTGSAKFQGRLTIS